MAFQPGDEVFNYEIGLTDPRFLDTDYSFGGTAGWSKREYTRLHTRYDLQSPQSWSSFGDIWYGAVSLSADRIKFTDIDDNVPQEIFNDRGPSTINSIGLNITRTTLEPFARPSEGSRIRMSIKSVWTCPLVITRSQKHISHTPPILLLIETF